MAVKNVFVFESLIQQIHSKKTDSFKFWVSH